MLTLEDRAVIECAVAWWRSLKALMPFADCDQMSPEEIALFNAVQRWVQRWADANL